jgi:hypothetical protein
MVTLAFHGHSVAQTLNLDAFSQIAGRPADLKDTDKLAIVAQGDSWFAYPRDGFIVGKKANIVDFLGAKDDLLIYSIASNGAEAVQMLSGNKKFALLKLISTLDLDVLLFSGGGNDIVGPYDFDFFLRKNPNHRDKRLEKAEDALHIDRFNRRLESVANSYRDLLDYMADFSKNRDLVVITHNYAVPIPDPTGTVLLAGMLYIDDGKSWMYPYLVAKGYTDFEDQRKIVKFMLEKFASTLNSLRKDHKNFVVVNTQGQVPEKEWRNEIHPSSVGFERLSNKIYNEILKPLYANNQIVAKLKRLRESGALSESDYEQEMKRSKQDREELLQ